MTDTLELVRRITELERTVDGLIKPEIPFVLIAETTLAVAAGSITFSSIPPNFKHLAEFVHLRSSVAAEGDNLLLQFNGDVGANYDYQELFGNAATAAAAAARGATSIIPGSIEGSVASNQFSEGIFFIFNYTNNGTEKTCLNFIHAFGDQSAAADLIVFVTAGHWAGTNPITSVTLTPSTGPTFAAGSVVQLYGIS